MIIVSQDKTEIINFDKVNKLRATKTGFIVSYENTYKAEGDCSNILGKYETESRAKEVLNDLCIYKKMFEYFKYVSNDARNYISLDWINNNIAFDIYEMPKE